MTVIVDHRPEAPAGPPKLDRDQLRRAQQDTLDTPRMNYSLLAKMMFKPVDLMYGKKGSYTKFAMLEIIARVPYQAWERMGYWAVHRHAGRSALARRVFERIVEARADQDNEQWHLLIMAELVERQGTRTGWFRFRLLPQVIAIGWWHFCWALYAIKPKWSHRLNADFEDHAEHTYAEMVVENPAWETTGWGSTLCAEYGEYASVADLVRQISHDERCHKRESEIHLLEPRVR
jgi:ubiquinol oxidase